MVKIMYSILIAVSAIIAIVVNHQGHFEIYKIFKPLTTVLILALPILFWNSKNPKYNYLIIAALVFCLIGDVLLLYEDKFLYGLASFLIGHLFFATAFISIQGFNKNLLPIIILLLFGGGYLLYLKSSLGDFLFPVVIYISVIVFMTWQAISLSINNSKKVFAMIAIAAVLFTFSDAVIAYDKFKDPFDFAGLLVLSTYWCAIFLFANSTQLLNMD